MSNPERASHSGTKRFVSGCSYYEHHEKFVRNPETYVLEFNDSLTGTNWTELPPPVTGDGSVKVFTDQDVTAPQRFYRVRAIEAGHD